MQSPPLTEESWFKQLDEFVALQRAIYLNDPEDFRETYHRIVSYAVQSLYVEMLIRQYVLNNDPLAASDVKRGAIFLDTLAHRPTQFAGQRRYGCPDLSRGFDSKGIVHALFELRAEHILRDVNLNAFLPLPPSYDFAEMDDTGPSQEERARYPDWELMPFSFSLPDRPLE